MTELDEAFDTLLKRKSSDPCCWRCLGESGEICTFMILFKECGNKRCPKATDHTLECTNSNEPNQKGSIYSEY